MGKEVSKRESTNLLYEPPEDLFCGAPPPRRIGIRRVIALVAFVALTVCAWTFAASGGFWETGETNETERGADIGETDARESTTERGETESEFETEKKPSTETSEKESVTEEERGENETEYTGSDEIEENREVDLSEIEKGEKYVINYSDKSVDIDGLCDRGFSGGETAGSGAPLVLIIHTHTSESYAKSGRGFKGLNTVVSAGEAMSAAANMLGVPTVHCTVIHDGKGGNAYANARETVSMMLEIYPSIKYVIDLHRLSVSIDGVTVKTVSGCQDGSAQIRLTVSSGSGAEWQESMAMSLALRKSLNRNDGRVCMPIVISPILPNGDLSRYYIMAEIGAEGNTVDEAMTAARRLAAALADVLID